MTPPPRFLGWLGLAAGLLCVGLVLWALLGA